MHNDHKVMMITLAGMAAAIWLFIKRKTTRPPSNEADGDDKTSSSDASITNLRDGETYELFLSFRGEDTRKDFTDHLYKRLVNVGVWVFRDNEALRVGEEIGPELDKAIEASKISIPIISPNYASSKWCLRELVHILEYKKTGGLVVLPIFYRIDPSSVRNQTGPVAEAFHSHSKEYGSNSKVVQEWRSALTEVASSKGWESSKIADGHEGELVEVVVTKVLNELRKATLIVTNCLVGIEDHKKLILNMVENKESSDARAIVIHGMGGVGKTTLAKTVYNQLSTKFDNCSFLPNIREKLSEQKSCPEELQKQLISDILGQQWPGKISHVDQGINIIKDRLKQKKVLILFDDVDHCDQLDALAKEHNWFRSGSVLIITTRNRDVLKAWEGRLTYELNELDPSHSFLLFCKHAFRRDECPMEFHAIAKDIVSTTGGLPLAIEVIGSMLLGKSKLYWEDACKKLQNIPHQDVQKKLRITYDELEHGQKQIFLDIACLSIRKSEMINFAFYMWDACKYFPREGIEKLISLSLIKMGQENQVIIHDQLRDLGRAIVHEEDNTELGNHSRLWDEEEALEVMQRNQGTAKIQALNLSFDHEVSTEDRDFKSDQFKNLTNLRFLQLKNANLVGDFNNLLLDLRWLQGQGWILVPLPTNFHLTKLVILDLSNSSITDQWEGWAEIELVKKLKVLKLEGCRYLTSSPDFSAFEKLEILILRGCYSLRRIHPSICNLDKTLLTLDVRDCSNLEKLPNEMGGMEELLHLLVDCTPIRTIPVSKGYMTKLENISARHCRRLEHLPDTIGSLMSLVSLSLDCCQSITMLPESIGDLRDMKVLDISKTSIKGLPTTIGQLENLQHFIAVNVSELTEVPEEIGELCSLQTLNLSECKNLKSMPSLPRSLTSLHFKGESMGTLPNLTNLSNLKDLCYHDKFERWNRVLNFGSLNNLKSLSINGNAFPDGSIENIELILELPSSLEELHLDGCPTLQALPSLSHCKMLSSLEIDRCHNLSNLSKLGDAVTYCRLTNCNALERLSHLLGAKKLKSLVVKGCKKLVVIQGLDSVECLEALQIHDCPSLERFGNLSYLKMLTELELFKCEKLSDFHGIDKLSLLQKLKIRCNPKIRSLDLSKLKNLEFLELNQLEILTEITVVQKLEYLKELEISFCNSLKVLPDITLFTILEKVHFYFCEKLTEIKGLKEQKNLKKLLVLFCNSLDKLPDISLFTNLEEVQVVGCENLAEIKAFKEQKSLKELEVSGCNSLDILPDISLFTSLEKLHVKECEKLIEIMALKEQMNLKNLQVLYCGSLDKLSDISLFTDLEEVHVSGCKKLLEIKGLKEQKKLKKLKAFCCNSLNKLPDISLFRSLEEVHVDECEKLKEIKALQRQKNLKELKISCCSSLDKLLDLSLFTSLEEVLVDGCEKLTEIEGLQGQKKLEKLEISRCISLDKLPDMSLSTSLQEVEINGCDKLTEIRGLHGQKNLEKLKISFCNSLDKLPDFSLFTNLIRLIVKGCEKLTEIEGLPMPLRALDISGCKSLINLSDLSPCCYLEGLFTGGCNKLTKIMGLQGQNKLRILDLSSCISLEGLFDFSQFENLEHVNLNGCEKLIEIKGLPVPLKTLDISGCKLLAYLPDLSQCYSLTGLLTEGCSKLTNIIGLSELHYLKMLDLSNCRSLEDFPDFSLFKKLEHLNLNGCEKLTEINGLPISLETLDISRCKLLKNLPDFSEFYSLKELCAEECSKLEEVRGLENLQGFCVLAIHGCESLKRKPDLPNDCIHSDPLHKSGESITLNRKITLEVHGDLRWDRRQQYQVFVVGINFARNSRIILKDYPTICLDT